MKVLFATTNPAKIEYYGKELERKGIKILTLKDLDVKIDVEENGKDAVENATIKAKAYYEIAKIPTISIDDSLFLEGVSKEKQPGTNVRIVNGKRLSDEEMLKYYSDLFKELGGKVSAKWIKGIAIYNGKELKTYCYSRSNFYYVDIPSKKIHEGYPLDSLAIIPKFNKYLSELTKDEENMYKQKSKNKEVFDFIIREKYIYENFNF